MLKAYLSAVPHWLYFMPLKEHQPIWIRFAMYTAMIGTVAWLACGVIAAPTAREARRVAGVRRATDGCHTG
ncbi:MAG: hypothetical protein GEU82_05275 [Luteitalea sp.]|nr:hypothetical protein [Luteitalea sp.]